MEFGVFKTDGGSKGTFFLSTSTKKKKMRGRGKIMT